MKKTLVISSLASGGAEKLLVRLADEWVLRGDEVRVITLRSPGSDTYHLSDRVKRVSLEADGLRWHSLIRYAKLLLRLRREIRRAQPDIILSFIIKTNILTLIATIGLPFPVVASEHSVIGRTDIARRNAGLRRLAYRRAASIVVLTEAARKMLGGMLPNTLVVSIPNPVMPEPGAGVSSRDDLHRYFPAASRTDSRYLVGMGRLHPVKGFDLLLEAFALIHADFPQWRLLIVGEGAERPKLEAIARERGIKDVVAMPGFFTRPQTVLRAADLFAVPSRFEGFGNVIIEAMAAGLAVVAFNCPDGPGEIITNGFDGILVEPESPPAMAEALRRLMDRPDERTRLAKAAAQSVRRYDLGHVLDMWDRLLTTQVAVHEGRA